MNSGKKWLGLGYAVGFLGMALTSVVLVVGLVPLAWLAMRYRQHLDWLAAYLGGAAAGGLTLVLPLVVITRPCGTQLVITRCDGITCGLSGVCYSTETLWLTFGWVAILAIAAAAAWQHNRKVSNTADQDG